MSSTSQKHRNFVSEPMGEKPVTDLAGIGEALGGRLKDRGFDKAYVVLGQFLLLKKNEELFKVSFIVCYSILKASDQEQCCLACYIHQFERR